MTIGFIVPNIAAKVIPDKTLSMSSSPQVSVAKFGDGYQQRIAKGLNSINEAFSIAFVNRPRVESNDIEAFFKSNKGVTSFAFTYPDTNSTTTAVGTTSAAVNNSNSVALAASANNVNISTGSTVTGTGIVGTVTVASISGNAVVLNSLQTIGSAATLTFTNPDERQIKVICTSWSLSFSNSNHYNVSAKFERVYEP
jgi:phage-related protein